MSKALTKVLVVDDDPVLRELFTRVLSRLGYAVESAHDGFSALAAMRAGIPHVLLSDLYMPGMSGFELLSVVRRRFPELPVIAMSSAYTGPEVPAGIAADAFYTKATDLRGLLGLVEEMGAGRGSRYGGRTKSSSPMSIAHRTGEGQASQIALGCPECLRTFFEFPADGAEVIREAACFYCSMRVEYAIVQNGAQGDERAVPLALQGGKQTLVV